jgi:hypothetical protein
LDGILGVLQLNVYAKRFIEHFTGFSLNTPPSGRGLFDADDLIAVRALAEAMSGAIHFVLWPQPAPVNSGFFMPQVSHRLDGLATPVDIQTDPRPMRRAMSASARKKIAAAQRARWAKFRAGQQKAA